jgi:prolyl oligopeptidase
VPVEQYPHVERLDFVEQLHGTPIADPYRWLEDPNNKATKTCAHRAYAL